ncbi:lipoprotein ABC transporter permease [Subtercola boreus]|uniref:Lipoprotein ABC transporter permease n=2 Tax=Subtercola boreus TaxID=120213 RepID=A0A3E0W5W0_9MICO|nr:lipoprotein ABC transporter permease [Subtercola boreus]RFA17827.1 lipoprotein ABC transporter permease [Subtercola boreus]RFA24379.1 lipoprotein ABC transporter permease [Subtercola boreus]
MVAGMCATVLLTTGRTVGAEQTVIGSIDSAGTRSIVIHAEPGAGLKADVLNRIATVDGIEWAGAFSTAVDFTNVSIPDGTKVPVRLAWGANLSSLGITPDPALPNGTAWASPLALTQLGMPDKFGGIASTAGTNYPVVGVLRTPDYLTMLEPLVVIPESPDTHVDQEVSVLVVIASRPDLVAPVTQAVQSILAVDDPTKVTITTSEELATLRSLVQGQLGSFGNNLVLVIFALTAVLVAAILYGLVMLRRKDFGRRRALGATRGLIILLLLMQMAILSVIGTLLGTGLSIISLRITNDPLPSFSFLLALAILAVAVGIVAALLPAVAASRRDPLKELRVP